MTNKTLTESRIGRITKPGSYASGEPGLILKVRAGRSKNHGANQSRSWCFRYTIDGRRHERGLGGHPKVTLADARRRALELRRTLAQGEDPFAQEELRFAEITFRAAAEEVHRTKQGKWRSESHRQEWLGSLERHVFAAIGQKPLAKISRSDILDVLLRGKARLWETKPATARRIRQRIRAVLAWGQAHGLYETNVAGSMIDAALPDNRPPQEHYRSLPYQEVGDALALVRASKAPPAVRLALEFLVLTATRSGEAREARWSEIDLDRRVWRIPAERMKAGREHRVPLSDAALAVLQQTKDTCPRIGDFVFGSERTGGAINGMTLTRLLRRTGLLKQATIHGMRTAFRTWAAERTDVDFATAELSLAHAVGSQVERAYSRTDLLEKRRHLMETWAAHVNEQPQPAQVVRLHG